MYVNIGVRTCLEENTCTDKKNYCIKDIWKKTEKTVFSKKLKKTSKKIIKIRINYFEVKSWYLIVYFFCLLFFKLSFQNYIIHLQTFTFQSFCFCWKMISCIKFDCDYFPVMLQTSPACQMLTTPPSKATCCRKIIILFLNVFGLYYNLKNSSL